METFGNFGKYLDTSKNLTFPFWKYLETSGNIGILVKISHFHFGNFWKLLETSGNIGLLVKISHFHFGNIGKLRETFANIKRTSSRHQADIKRISRDINILFSKIDLLFINIIQDREREMKQETIYFQSIDRKIIYFIGKNAKDNFKVIDQSLPTDIWFHIHNESSCHVIAEIPYDISNLNDKREIIIKGAQLCKENTNKFKATNKKLVIIYDFRSNIITTKTAGCVITNDATAKYIKI